MHRCWSIIRRSNYRWNSIYTSNTKSCNKIWRERDEISDEFKSPFEYGDSLYVEIHSIPFEAFDFLNKVSIQIDRQGGFGELFAVSLANSPTNLTVENNSNFPVVGFFCVSAVNGMGNILDDDEIEKIEKYDRKW